MAIAGNKNLMWGAVVIAGLIVVAAGIQKQKTAPTEALVEPVQVVAALTGKQLCTRDLTTRITFKDPDSVRVNSIESVESSSSSYLMSVSAKNSYGGYGNPIPCNCTADVPAGEVTYLFCGS